MKQNRKSIEREIRRLQDFQAKTEDIISLRFAYTCSEMLRWSLEDTVSWEKPLEAVKSNVKILKEEIERLEDLQERNGFTEIGNNEIQLLQAELKGYQQATADFITMIDDSPCIDKRHELEVPIEEHPKIVNADKLKELLDDLRKIIDNSKDIHQCMLNINGFIEKKFEEMKK